MVLQTLTTIYQTLPPNLDDTSFIRFNIYAQFIKHLEIYSLQGSSRGRGCSVVGWPLLSEKAKHRTLLPKLSRLTLSAISSPSSDEQFLWIRMFISPSLKAIQVQPVVGHPHHIHYSTATALIGHIFLNCPNLHTLSLFPLDPPPNRSRLKDLVDIVGFWEPSFYDRLSALSLRNLTCAINIFAPSAVHVLAELPLLEHLEVHYASDNASPEIATSKMEPLPALRHFALCSKSWSKALDVLELGIFTGITSLTVTLGDADPEIDDPDAIDSIWGPRLMSLISRGSPLVSSLKVDLGLNIYFEIDSTSILDPLATLPLESVTLSGFAAMSSSVIKEMHGFFPLVTKFEVPDVEFGLDDMYLFSRLPNLQHLTVGLSICLDSLDSRPTPCAILPSIRILEINGPLDIEADLSPLARCVQLYLLFFITLKHGSDK